jgi:hypothetical protein
VTQLEIEERRLDLQLSSIKNRKFNDMIGKRLLSESLDCFEWRRRKLNAEDRWNGAIIRSPANN